MSIASKALGAGLVVAVMAGTFAGFTTSAKADDYGRRHWRERQWEEHHRRQEYYRTHRYGSRYYYGNRVYVAPPVVYGPPPPPPGLNLMFNIR